VDAASPDAPEIARRRALAAIAEQVRVEISSRFRSEEQVTVAGGRETSSLRAASAQETKADAVLEGAEVLDTCSAGSVLRVRVGLHRDRFAAAGKKQLESRASAVRAADAGAADALRRGARLEAARQWAKAAVEADDAERLRAAILVVSRQDPGVALPTSHELDARARDAIAAAHVAVHADAPVATALLEGAGVACLAKAGLPASQSQAAPDAILALRAILDPPLQVAQGLFVVRGQLSVVLERNGAALSGSDARAKGGGTTPDAASQDAVRRLASESLPALVDAAFADWPGLRRCAAAR
jgi:hypothetical protein